MFAAEASFQKGTGVDTGRGMPLYINQITAVVLAGYAPEMVEAHLIQGAGGGIGGNMTADAGILLVGVHHHGHGVPADVRLDALFNGAIAGILRFLGNGNGVDVGGVGTVRQIGAGTAGLVYELLDRKSVV